MGRNLFRTLIANGLVRLPEKVSAAPEPAPRRRMLLERLEDRLLFDAGPVAPVDADAELAQQAAAVQEAMPLEGSIAEPAEVRVIDTLDDVQEMIADLVGQPLDGGSELALNPNETSNDAELLNSDELARQLLTTSDEQRTELSVVRREVAFVDTSVAGYEQLVDGILDHGDQYRQIEVVLIDAGEDGLERIAQTMRSLEDIDAIHLVSHGGSGQLRLGRTMLNLDSMGGAYAEQLVEIGEHLGTDADILVYGCDFAAGDAGRAAVNFLSRITGADVSASDDATGNAQLGGDWLLEQTVGTIESFVAVNSLTQVEWQSLLAILDWDSVNWTNESLSGSYTVGGGTIDIDITGDTGDFETDSPNDETTNSGGLSPVEESLFLYVDYESQTTLGDEQVVTTIDFTHAGGVSDVSFTIFDIDLDSWTDQIIVTANNGSTINPTSVTNGSTNTFDGTNMVTGTSSNDSSSGNGNATFTFNQTGITQVLIVYRSGRLSDPSGQFISLHDINFNVAPVLDLDASGAGTGYSTTFTEDGSAVAIADTDSSVTDADSANMSRAVITLTNPQTSDALSVLGALPSGISLDAASTSTNIILTGSSSRANYETAIEQIRFNNTSQNPNTTARSVTVVVTDDMGAPSNTATTTITVNAANDAPDAVNDSFTTAEDTSVAISVLTNDTDPEGNSLTITQVNGTAITAGGAAVAVTNGSVTLNGAGTQLTFSPSLNYNGAASFTYTISDGNGGTDTATVSGTVTSVNDAPDAVNDSFTTAEDTSVAISVLTNDTDPDGNSLTITQVNGTAIAAGGAAVTVTNGSVTLNGAGTQLTFSPSLNYNGAASFTYTISDGNGGTDTATVSGTVTAVNDAPDAVNDSFTTAEDTPVAISVLTNDTDSEGNTLTITHVNGTAITAGGAAVTVTNGSVTLNGAGTQLTFSPSLNYNGAASFTYTISDGNGGTDTATVSGTVTSVNDAPDAVNDSFTTAEDTSVAISVLTNDTDPDGNTLTITQVNGTAIAAGGAAVTVTNGSVTLNGAGTQLTFSPSLNYNGSASFTYTISDGNGETDTATVSGTVTAVNDAPTGGNRTVTTAEDTDYTFTTADFPFSDVDGDALSRVRIDSLPSDGTVWLGGAAVSAGQIIAVSDITAGNLTFRPDANENGSPYTTFTFSVGDISAFVASPSTMTVHVTPVNDAPTTSDNVVSMLQNSSYTFDASDFPFSDVDAGDSLQSVRITSLPSVGSLTLSGVPVAANDVISVASLGNLVFTPVVNENGSPYTTFEFQVSDGTVFSNTATMTVNVVAVPDLSVTVDDGGVTATANDTVVYSLGYANNGMQDATGVYLLETVPTGSAFNAAASSPGWFNIGGNDYRLNLGSVPMGASGTALFAVTVNSAIAAGQTQLVNSASIADDGTHGTDANAANNTDDDTTPLDVAPDLELTKSDGAAAVTPGASVIYSLGYANNGTQDATGVFLTETLPIGSAFDAGNSSLGWSFVGGSTYQFNVGNVAVGASGTVLFAVTVDAPALAGQSNLENLATIADDGSNGPDLDPTDNSPTDTDTLNAQPDYQLTLSDAVASVVPGDAVTYTVTITNAGNQNGTGVVVSGLFPNAILHNVVVTGGGVVDETSGTISWSVGNFAVGALQTFTITADVWTAIGAGIDDYTVTASITDDLTNGSDPTPANNFSSDTNTLDAAPDLRVTKTDFLNSTTPGECLVYSVSIANVGNQDATNVVITETVPVGTTFNSTLSDPLWVLVAPDTYQITLTSLAAGASFNIDFDVDVTSPATPGQTDIVNTVTITDDGTNGPDPNPGDNTGTDTNTLVSAPDYQITIDDGELVVVPGQSLSYSIRFTNTGDQNGSGVVVSDTFPSAILENVIASDGGVVDSVAGTITWNVGNLAVGESRTFTVTAKVRDTVPAGFDDFTHDTSITDDLTNGTDPTLANNSAADTDTLNATPDYHIAITDGETAVVPGQSLSYTISFLNAGAQDGTGVIVSDTFPTAILENVIASDGGVVDAVAGTITWNVGNLAAGESRSFTVTAKVRDTIPAGWDDFTHATTISDDAINGADPTPADNAAADNDTLNAQPDYQISIDDGVLSATTGQSLAYSVTFANAGFQDGTGVVVSNSFPLSVLTNVVASNGGIVDMTTGTIVWNVGSLAAGASLTYTVTADVLSSVVAGLNDFTHSTSITDDLANGTDPTPADNSASDTDVLNAAPDLRITKTDFTNSISPGGGSVYTLNVSNIGTQEATNVLVTETLPVGTSFNLAFSDPSWTSLGGGVYQYSIASLIAGAGFNINFSVLIDNPAAAGQADIVNTATIADDGTNGPDLDPTNDSATDTNTLDAVPNYDIGIDDGQASATPGESLTYLVNFNNAGLQNGTGVVVSAIFPTAMLTNVVASNGGIVDAVAGTITWNVGALTANDPRTFTVTADVRSTVPAGVSDFTLSAAITDDGTNGTDPDLSDNSSSDTDTLDAQPDYAITIDDGETLVRPGDPLTYTINVANNGNQDGTGVIVTVNFPVTVLQNAVASNGGVVDSLAGTITWNLGNLAAGDSTTLTVSTQVRSNIGSQTPSITLTATVTDDGANGIDPTPLNNTDSDLDRLQVYAYDSFHDWKDMRFGFQALPQQMVGRPLAPLPVDPVFSGLTEPGSTLVARIYDADGRMLGDRQVVADSAGNWLVSFPNIIIYEYPHRMEIIVTPAVNNLAHENGFNLRRYFHPAIHAGLVMTEPLSIAGVFRNRAYNIVEAQHSANIHPLGFQWYSHAYELNAASSNVSQM